MNGTLLIARRELLEKRFVLFMAVAFALVSLLVPLLPRVQASQRDEAIGIVSLLLAINFTVGLAAVLGASMVGRELSEGRLSFYFSRPFPAPSIWFGKLMASLALIVISFCIVVAPAFLAGARSVLRVWIPSGVTFPLFVVGVIGVFLIAHVLSTFVRSRSTWIVFDLVAGVVIGTAVFEISSSLLAGGAVELTRTVWWVIGVAVMLSVIGAGAWQLARGRTERRRSHLELSRFLWASLGILVLAATLFTWWVITPSPNQLKAYYVSRSQNGWTFMVGTAPHRGDYHAVFLYNVEDGRFARLGPSRVAWLDAHIARDGSSAAWVQSNGNEGQLYRARLGSGTPRPEATRIIGHPRTFMLSNDGSRAAVFDANGLLSVYDLASSSSLGSVRAPDGFVFYGFFVNDQLLRFFVRHFRANDVKPDEIFEFDVKTKQLTRTGQVGEGGVWIGDDGRILQMRKPRTTAEVRDGRTGAVIATITSHPAAHFRQVVFLQDGRILAIESGDRTALRLFSASGQSMEDVALGAGQHQICGVMRDRYVMLAIWPSGQRSPFAAMVDLQTGATRQEPSLHPMLYGGATGGLLCQNDRKETILWNPIAGTQRKVAGS